MNEVTIVGGGLAGSEAAWQLADRGVPVRLYEMRPHTETGAHKTAQLAEIVCSNSFKSMIVENASGLLKAEMELLGCRLLTVAHKVSVPAGHALGIDRELFASHVTDALEKHPNITIERSEVLNLDLPRPTIVATGPLTGSSLSEALEAHCSSDHLYFYDAIAPSIDGDSIDDSVAFWQSRYDKGDADYLNIPLSKEDYESMLGLIRSAEYAKTHAFEEAKYFEACLPVEVLAARGDDTLRYGPMKPKGLIDPRTGREPYAAIQLRQESREGSLMGMVGIQTRMTWPCQKEMIRNLPGMERANILRYGTIHRNIFMNIPELCDRYFQDRTLPGLYFAGQICGVEGYVESIASGMVAAMSIYANLSDRSLPMIPHNTMIGALLEYVHTPTRNFQPMNANMGLMPYDGPRKRGGRKERNHAIATAAIDAMTEYRRSEEWLFVTA